MAEDIGESLVGAYLRYVKGCEFVLFNTYLDGEQGELDVIGIHQAEPRRVYFAEVTTHLEGMDYGGNRGTVERIAKKLERAKRFAAQRFPEHEHHFQVWSPRVAVGTMTGAFDDMASDLRARGTTLEFVINEKYGDAVNELLAVARTDARATSDPAFRLLQVLVRLRSSGGGVL